MFELNANIIFKVKGGNISKWKFLLTLIAAECLIKGYRLFLGHDIHAKKNHNVTHWDPLFFSCFFNNHNVKFKVLHAFVKIWWYYNEINCLVKFVGSLEALWETVSI